MIRPDFPPLRVIAGKVRPPATDRLIARMALDLLRLAATGSEREAIRALSSGPYRLGDVTALAEEALFEARQGSVAKTMAGS